MERGLAPQLAWLNVECYGWSMLNAYLGIVGPHGLDLMVPEHAHTLVFLMRRLARRERRGEYGVWIVLPQEFAADIAWLMEAGEFREALRWVQLAARDFGVLLPEHQAAVV